MKKIIYLFFIFSFLSSRAQQIDLYSIINKSYSIKHSYSVINNKKIFFIKPKNISFLKINHLNEKYSFEVVTLKSENDLKELLESQNQDVLLFEIIFDNIYENSLVVTLQMKSTNYKMYTDGIVPFYVFEDERKVLLKYNKKYNKWEFYKIIEITEEAHT